jgi:beta-galactosidase/beta-glucuronidase
MWAFLLAVGASGSSVSLDLGWRFHRGVPAAPCTSTFNTNYTTQQCDGLANGASAETVGECEALCCADLGCQIWQWLGGGGEGAGCWFGLIPSQGCNPNTQWVSFANASRGVEVPGWAALTYADTPANNWSVVDFPHDFIITGADPLVSPYDRSAQQGQAFIPKTVGAYRKHFAVPAAWRGQHIELYVEGMYAYATYYLNGAFLGTHALGYTSFFARLDNNTAPLLYGGAENVLAVFVDATEARDTGWWYEGGGGCRHTFLTASPAAAHIVPHGLHADVSLTEGFAYPASPADGVVARAATVLAFAEVESDSSASPSAVFTLFDASGAAVASAAAKAVALSPAAPTGTLLATLQLYNASAWSVGRPYLYTLSAALGGAGGHTVNASIGLRSVRWDADEGVFINEQRVRFRAFCDHESFTAVGMAVPDRVNLFRYQAMRGMGGNGRRFSHNPPAPALLDLADRLGLLTLDENRVFALGLSPNMVDLVQRDRNHASVIFWSFCNEPGCNNGDKSAPQQPTQDFKYAAVVNDGTRAVTGNMCVNWGSCPNLADYVSETGLNMSQQLDVQGFSHVDTGVFEAYHARWPAKPLVASECCSCETQRGEANDLPYNKTLVFYSEFNADCVARETNWALGLDFVAGSFVWTAFDYCKHRPPPPPRTHTHAHTHPPTSPRPTPPRPLSHTRRRRARRVATHLQLLWLVRPRGFSQSGGVVVPLLVACQR